MRDNPNAAASGRIAGYAILSSSQHQPSGPGDNRPPLAVTEAVAEFLRILEAVTLPVEAGFELPDLAGARALTIATEDLHFSLLSQLLPREMVRRNSKVVNILSPPTPGISACVMPPNDTVADCQFEAVFWRALKVTEFTSDRWNLMQTENAGGNHLRWWPGDVISKVDVELIKSVQRLLRLTDEAPKDHGNGEPSKLPPNRRSKNADQKQSWTQRDLDNAIRQYKAKRASTFADLAANVKAGRKGALKDARRLFGRNSIAKALNVRSKAMVSKSLEWQEIAKELGIEGKTGSRLKQRSGLEIAIEQKAAAEGDQVTNSALRNETVRLIQTHLDQVQAEATIEKLERGDMTDDEARSLVHFMRQE